MLMEASDICVRHYLGVDRTKYDTFFCLSIKWETLVTQLEAC